jgi:aldoxime dehydratase
MESAIPPHLMMARTCPSRAGGDAEPPYPSFVARHPTSVHQLVMAYLEPSTDQRRTDPRRTDRSAAYE